MANRQKDNKPTEEVEANFTEPGCDDLQYSHLHWNEFSSSQNLTNQIRYMKAFVALKDQKLKPIYTDC